MMNFIPDGVLLVLFVVAGMTWLYFNGDDDGTA